MLKLSIFVLVLLLFLGEGKRVEGVIDVPEFNRERWRYITKFGINIGEGSYRVRVRFGEKIDELHKPPEFGEITLEVHIDDN